MKGLIVLAFVCLFASGSCANSGVLDTVIMYEMLFEGFVSNITLQMNYKNASICFGTVHQILDILNGLISGSGTILSYLVNTRDLFLKFIQDIDYCPQVIPAMQKIIAAFMPLFTDPYHFIWKFANNVALNGIDIYYHIGYAMKILNGPVKNRDFYFNVGTIFGDMVFDIFIFTN